MCWRTNSWCISPESPGKVLENFCWKRSSTNPVETELTKMFFVKVVILSRNTLELENNPAWHFAWICRKMKSYMSTNMFLHRVDKWSSLFIEYFNSKTHWQFIKLKQSFCLNHHIFLRFYFSVYSLVFVSIVKIYQTRIHF